MARANTIRGSDLAQDGVKERLRKLVPSLGAESESALDSLLTGTKTVRFRPQQFAYRIGDDCDAFLILLAGSLRVQLASSKGRKISLCRIAPGRSCVVTTSCLLSSKSYPAEAIAETTVDAISIPREAFDRALGLSNGFRRFVFSEFSAGIASVVAKIEQLAFVSVDSRLSGVLLGLHKNGEDKITHQALAVELGTAREVVSRRLKEFECSGWVRLERGRVIVSDQVGLQSLGNSSLCD